MRFRVRLLRIADRSISFRIPTREAQIVTMFRLPVIVAETFSPNANGVGADPRWTATRSHAVGVLALFLIGCFGEVASARWYSPRVVSPRVADAYSCRTFAEHPAWKDLAPETKAKAMFDYLTDPETGLFPPGGAVFEGPEKHYEYAMVRDPIKLINVYGCGFCDAVGPAMAGLWEQGGCGPARTVSLPGMQHTMCEVFAKNRWRYIDLDLRGVFLDKDGQLRSLDEARKDVSLWERERGPSFFPKDDLATLKKQYEASEVNHRYGVAPTGHTMDFVLRRGETFTRWWQPQGDRWLVNEADLKDKAYREILERSPRGPKPKHPNWSKHTHGNGRFVYEPSLKRKADDFEDGVFDSYNVHVSAAGLTLIKPGDGWAVFEVRSPYVIVPEVGKIDDVKDDKAASVVEVDAAETTLAWSPDYGDSWITLEPKQWPATMDLTKDVAGSYGYLLKIALKGKPDAAVVRSLKVTTWVQMAPATLPALHEGDNTLELKVGDHYGLPTRVRSIQPNAADDNAFLHYLIRAPKEFDPTSRSDRAKGTMIARLPSLPKTKIAWFSAGASFRMSVGNPDNPPRNAIRFAVDSPRDFKPLFKDGPDSATALARPTEQTHWHYNIYREVKLDKPANSVYIEYEANPSLNAYRMIAHCLDDQPRPAPPLTVKHVWTEGDAPKEHSQTLDAAGRYAITAGADPVNTLIELSVPSSGAENLK